eukprot:GHVR01066852.1.p2 GENE.GHVR01066852.1~~GHVR01066852.1.p2  ORF type:complete len:330 (+),score=19.29 GHVR01066852.1:1362-2351(+)
MKQFRLDSDRHQEIVHEARLANRISNGTGNGVDIPRRELSQIERDKIEAVALVEQQHENAKRGAHIPCNGLPSCVLKARPGCIHNACRLCCRKLRLAAIREHCEDSHHTTRPNVSNLSRSRQNGLYPECGVHRDSVSSNKKDSRQRQGQQTTIITDSTELRFLRVDYAMDDDNECSYNCESKVLLIGTGADELLGGYRRHKRAKQNGGLEAARQELLLDLRRLWIRNLGRDDRCVSATGKEARHPFLDEELVNFVGQLPFSNVASDGSLWPNKWLLREAAVLLQLRESAEMKKRAIQFGSRSARWIGAQKKEGAHVIGEDEYLLTNSVF